MQVVFVSVNPARDSNEELKKYVTSFNNEFIGLKGSQNQIVDFKKQLGIFSNHVHIQEGSKTITLPYSNSILVINPSAKLYAIFSSDLKSNKIASDLEKIMQSRKI